MGNIFLDMEEEGVCYGLEGLKILIYGGDTLGKTPQAMRFPKPVLFMAESGGSALKGMKMPIMSKKDFTKAVADLTDPKTLDAVKEKVKTIVIDTVEDVVELFKAAVCAKYGVEDVGQVQQAEKGNPNGYNLYRTQFKKQINLLTSSGYTVIFISHEETIQVSTGEFDDKGNELTRPFIICLS